MTTNYSPAQVAAVATTGEFICGWKIVADTWDCITGEMGTMFIIALDSLDYEKVRPHSLENTNRKGGYDND